ncbi:hypothetical protein [Asticcacaulis sp.]|uniref:hypothetical protein n=1 Tax=Asticcacaulis sp. TaxID=1872648 RepID=UPI002CA18A69|nr:hypothetical protein [Asticcacaulis sp.]HTM80042.1 hypothetical protein [Asticcacaulis sp.]
MRLLRSSVLTLSVCAFAFSAAIPADAATTKKRPAAAKTTAKKAVAKSGAEPAMDNSPAATGRNADGSLHAPTLEDAPKDDFLRVAWCHGVLSGNMEMAELVDSVMPVDDQIQTIGLSYLRAYEAALTLSGKGKDEAQHKKAEEVRDYGYNEWAATRTAPTKEAAYAYANWQLPGDCEHAAVRLSGHPNLFAEMATEDELDAIALALSSGGPHDYEEKPKPVLTASTAPVDGDGPLATNTLARRATASRALPSVPQTANTGDEQVETTYATQQQPDPNHVEKRSWSEGLGYRLGWTNVPKKKIN